MPQAVYEVTGRNSIRTANTAMPNLFTRNGASRATAWPAPRHPWEVR